MFQIRILLLPVILVAVTLGCTKKRAERFSQGSGLNLQAISELDGKTFQLRTGEIISKDTKTSSEKLVIEGDIEGIRHFPLVSYTTDATLLGEVPFRGRPNASYQIRYRLLQRYLRIEKVASEKDIPSDEITYAEKLSDGTYAVPLVGYEVSYVRIENMLNSDNESTNLKTEIVEQDPKNATYVRINPLRRILFDALNKVDVYPAKYFEGEWFFSETIVATAEGSNALVGDAGTSIDSSFNAATRVKFDMGRDQLLALNVNVDARLAEVNRDQRLNYKTVLSIPINWKNYRIDYNGTGDALNEKEDNDIRWNQKPYMQIDFENVRSISGSLEVALADISESITRLSKGNKLTDINFAQNYFSFSLLDLDKGKTKRYAFLRVGERKDFKPRQYKRVDRKHFGYFTSSWSQVFNYEMYRQEDIERNTFLNRFNPNKDIIFHMTNTSPEDELVGRIAKRAARYWDIAFQLAGAKSRVKFDDQKRVDLGDIRYNVIHFIDTVSTGTGGILGFGPSLADPFTGETIMATSNINVAATRGFIVSDLRAYIRQVLGQFDNITNNRPELNPTSARLSQSTRNFGFSNPLQYQFQIAADGTAKDIEVPYTDYIRQNQNQTKSINDFSPNSKWSKLVMLFEQKKGMRSEPPKSAWELSERFRSIAEEFPEVAAFDSHRNREQFKITMTEEIEERCPDLKAKIQTELSGPVTTKKELATLKPCIDVFLEERLLSTLVHEMGHNFGLSHNFRGSADENNFWSKDELKQYYSLEVKDSYYPKTAATMDYLTYNDLMVPGKYEVAAINFGYVDDSRQSKLKINLANAPQFCDDLDAHKIGSDPLCKLHDLGSTPSQIVDNHIRDIQQSLVVNLYRMDRINAPSQSRMDRNLSLMLELKRFYDQWRFILQNHVGDTSGYLQGMYNPKDPNGSATSYKEKVLKKIASQAGDESDFKLYRPVRDKIYYFLRDLSLIPDSLCMYSTPDNEMQWISFKRARELVKANKGKNLSVYSCNDKVVSEVIKSVLGGTYIKQLGLPVESYLFPLDLTEARYQDLDVVGVGPERTFASLILGLRLKLSSTISHAEYNLMPSILDEPDLRNDFTNNVLERITKGAIIPPSSHGQGDFPLYAEVFSGEASILMQNYEQLFASSQIPGSADESFLRLAPMKASLLNSRTLLNAEFVDSEMVNGRLIAVRRENTMTARLLGEYRFLEFRKSNINEINKENVKIKAAFKTILETLPAGLPQPSSFVKMEDFKKFTAVIAKLIEENGEDHLISKLIVKMFPFEIQAYLTYSQIGPSQSRLQARLEQIQNAVATGKDANGKALSPEQIQALESQAAQLNTFISRSEGLLKMENYSDFIATLLESLGDQAQALPPQSDLRRERMQTEVEQLTKSGDPKELDAKLNLIMGALMMGMQ